MSEFWKDKPVLVTGAGGFIGSHLTEHLLDLGAHVTAFVHYNSRAAIGRLNELSSVARQSLNIAAGDLRDLPTVQEAVAGQDLVFHLGALISIPWSYHHPQEVSETNIMGTLNVLLACRDQKTTRLIHTSSSEVYGTARQVPISEGHCLQAQSPYAASKIAADKLVESFVCAFELPVVTVRPFNAYGPRQSARAVIPTIITQALTSDVVHLGCLDARRDFTYVTDTVDGFLRAAESPDAIGKAINLGTGCEVTIRQLVDIVIAAIGHPVGIQVEADRLRPQHSEVMRLLADNSLARAVLGWQPQVPLAKGVQDTVNWMRDNLRFYRPGVYEM